MVDEKSRNLNKERILSVILTLLYIAVHVFIAIHHEAWRDEGQSWMLVKNSTVSELLADLCVEGHPALWFFTIMPFIKLGLPFRLFSLISLISMGLAFYCLVRFSPFPYWIRVLLSFSSLFMYYNPVIPRIYSEVALLVIVLSLLFPKRAEHPWLYGLLLLLLAQSHILLEGLTIGLVFECFIRLFTKKKERSKATIPFAMGTISGLTAIAELFPRAGTNRSVDISASGIFSNFTMARFILLRDATTYSLWGFSGRFPLLLLSVFLALGVICLSFLAIRRYGFLSFLKWGSIVFISFGIPLFIVFFVYSIHNQMATILLLLLLGFLTMLWATCDSKGLKYTALIFVLALSLATFPQAFSAALYDINGPYSNSMATADYIVENADEDSVILVAENEYNSPIYGYVSDSRPDIEFYSFQKYEPYKYHVWGVAYPQFTPAEIASVAVNLFNGRSVYLLLPYGIEDDTWLEDLILANSENPAQEYYIVYNVNA
ncbi:MAG: hypothetical protein IJI78_07380 [Oscillospiraceae bacterium]|nr:hypothetical protein [Oscillospiraceae bacterium]